MQRKSCIEKLLTARKIHVSRITHEKLLVLPVLFKIIVDLHTHTHKKKKKKKIKSPVLKIAAIVKFNILTVCLEKLRNSTTHL